MKISPLLLTDFYKVNHGKQYPEGTEMVYSNFTARNGKYEAALQPGWMPPLKGAVFFGLQAVLIEMSRMWKDDFFAIDIDLTVKQYQDRMDKGLGPNQVDTDRIRALHKLGYLPVEVRALPEGTIVPFGVPMFTIKNNKKGFGWLTNYLESYLSTELWKIIRTSTTANQWRFLLDAYAIKTGAPMAGVPFQAHDFSMRGMGSWQDSMKSGGGHITSFTGSDAISSIEFVDRYYGDGSFLAGSIPATEHSVMCLGIALDGEPETYRKLIVDKYPSGLIGIVSDTVDYWNVITNIIPGLKKEIMARDGKVVIRPDSGDPESIICGTLEMVKWLGDDPEMPTALDKAESYIDEARDWFYNSAPHGELGADTYTILLNNDLGEYHKVVYAASWDRHDKQYYYLDCVDIVSCELCEPTAEEIGTVAALFNVFEGTTNSEGFATLDSHIGVIYGDSITLLVADKILKRLANMGFASDNIVFGIGSYTYNFCTRDNLGIVIKATCATVDGVTYPIFKAPKTDSGKNSAKGYLQVEWDENTGELMLLNDMPDDVGNPDHNWLEIVPTENNSFSIKKETINNIRQRLAAQRDPKHMFYEPPINFGD